MKERRRQIPHRDGRAREGMYRERVWQGGEAGTPPAKGPLEQLQDILATCDRMLEGMPGPDDYYTVRSDGPLVNHGPEHPGRFVRCNKGMPCQSSMMEDIDRAHGIEAHHYPIERLSSEYFAWLSREAAQSALAQIEAGDLMAAMDHAMTAIYCFKDMQAVNTWEEKVIRAERQDPTKAREARSELKNRALAIMVQTIKDRGLKKGSPKNRPAFFAALDEAGIQPTDKQYASWLSAAFEQAEEK